MDTSGLIDGVQKFTVGSATAAAVVISLLLLGVAAFVSQEPRHALGKADSDLVQLVVAPVALFVLIVLPLAMLYRLTGVLADRRSRVVAKSMVLFGVALLLLYVPLLVDLVLTLRNPQHRSLEDRIATTRVVRAHVTMPVAAPVPEEAPRALVAA